MKVTVFGAANAVGREVVADLVFRGHEVTACVPTPGEAPAHWRGEAEIAVGAVTDPAAVGAAVAGAQAVVNALDPRLEHPARVRSLTAGTETVVAAMQAHGVRRYIGYSSPAVALCPQERAPARVLANRAVVRSTRPQAFRQMAGMLDAVTGADLDWTIVRFIHPTRRNARGLRFVGFFGEETIGAWATETDIARFTATQVLDTAYLRSAPAVSN